MLNVKVKTNNESFIICCNILFTTFIPLGVLIFRFVLLLHTHLTLLNRTIFFETYCLILNHFVLNQKAFFNRFAICRYNFPTATFRLQLFFVFSIHIFTIMYRLFISSARLQENRHIDGIEFKI